LKVGDVELDQLTQRVSRAGRSIDLTAKEFSLLTYLMLNAERVLSRNMILEQVWDQSFDGISNIIEVYICQLREKLHDEGKPELIRTIRGSGYSIRVKR
jgi:two-component system copper resistance phosphate regulon response regulator CusR